MFHFRNGDIEWFPQYRPILLFLLLYLTYYTKPDKLLHLARLHVAQEQDQVRLYKRGQLILHL